MKRKVYCLGFFDSMHRGHRVVFDEGKRLASQFGTDLCVLTFGDGIYKALGKPEKEIFLLRERMDMLKSENIEVIVLPARKEFLDSSAEEFLDSLEDLNALGFVTGSDYRFGKNASGDVNTLINRFKGSDVFVSVCPLLSDNGRKISTTDIRNLLKEGNISSANSLLGFPYFISGTVVGGFRNGRLIGIPTANVDFEEEKFIPANGVYVTKTTVGGKSYVSVSNVGSHPTFGDAHVNLETHLLDYDKEIYGENIKVEFYEFLRGVKSFSSVEQLKNQISYDITCARRYFL